MRSVRLCIVEADNLLVGLTIPSVLGINDTQWSIFDIFREVLFAQLGVGGLGRRAYLKRRRSAAPMQGPIYATVLARNHGYKADLYHPRLSRQAADLEALRRTIKRYDMVFVSALTNTVWAQKHVVNIAREEEKIVVATGASARMYEDARSLLIPGTMPASRHRTYNDDTVPYLGADYVLQHNHFDAFLELVDAVADGRPPAQDHGSIQGVGFLSSDGAVCGLTRDFKDRCFEELPAVTLDMRVISGFEKLEAIYLTGCSQGCTRSCDFCQAPRFTRGKFTFLGDKRLFDHLECLVRAGLLKQRSRLSELLRPFKNVLVFTDDSPVLGGGLEHDLPFDYLEFSKVLNRLAFLTGGRRRARPLNLQVPPTVVESLDPAGKGGGGNPFLLQRLHHLGLSLVAADHVEETTDSPGPVDLADKPPPALINDLQTILCTAVRDPSRRPFAPSPARRVEEIDNWGNQLNRSYIEFCRMFDSIEAFQHQSRIHQVMVMQLSVRAVNFLDEFDPFILRRAHRLGLEFVWVGFEDLIREDNRGQVGGVKSTRKENLRAITALRKAGIIVGAQLICTMRDYQLGYAQKVVERAAELKIGMLQLFAETSFEGTPATRRNQEMGILLHQVAPGLFGKQWRDLGRSLMRGETVSATPENASSLGMQLDMIKAMLSFGRLGTHLKGYRGWREYGVLGTLNALTCATAMHAGAARDLLDWLKNEKIRNGKPYLRLLAEIDPRWRSEAETVRWIRELELEHIVGLEELSDPISHEVGS